jgi:uncharacterized membrane protein YkoI
MVQRNAFVLAGGITAFLLLLVGSVMFGVAQQRPTSVVDVAGADSGTLTLDPTAQALLLEREAAYQQALAEASARVDQANQQLAQVNAQSSAAQTSLQPASVTAPTQPAATQSPEQAATSALSAYPGATLSRTPELVAYQGVPAYEVVLDIGTLYLDAQNGQILASSVTPQAPAYGDEDERGEDEGSERHDDND